MISYRNIRRKICMHTLEDLFDKRSAVGARLEQILVDKKCTKAELSKKTGVSRPTIDKVLSGTVTSKKNYETHMSKIMHYLQITPDILLGNSLCSSNRVREIRSIIKISTERMANATGISQERLQQIEAGDVATITELRDIAMQLRTSTHVITNQYFFEPQFSEIEYYMDMKDALDEISGFWGHVGIKLCGMDKYMWFPITSNTRRMIYRGINEKLMVVPCMNNKVLLLNMSNIEDISLSDFDADEPSGKDWDENVSCGEIPLIVYEALEDYGQETLYNDIENSAKLQEYLTEYIRKNKWTEEDIFRLLNTSSFYYLDGRKQSIIIDYFQEADSIIETIEMVYGYGFTDIEQNFMFYIDAHDETQNFVNLKGISMIELPLLKVEEEIFRRNNQ